MHSVILLALCSVSTASEYSIFYIVWKLHLSLYCLNDTCFVPFISLCSPTQPKIHYVSQTGFQLGLFLPQNWKYLRCHTCLRSLKKNIDIFTGTFHFRIYQITQKDKKSSHVLLPFSPLLLIFISILIYFFYNHHFRYKLVKLQSDEVWAPVYPSTYKGEAGRSWWQACLGA